MPRSVWSLIILGTVCLCGCVSSSTVADENHFFTRPLGEQHKLFKTYSLERQYAIYIESMQQRHPPDIAFAYELTSAGKKAADFLIRRLESGEDEWTQEHIFLAFEVMAKQGSYDVKGDKALINKLKVAVAAMKNVHNREASQASLRDILSGR